MVIQNMACTYVQTPVCRNGDCWSPNVAPRCEQRFGERISGFGWHYAPEVQCSAGKGDPVSKRFEDRNRPGKDDSSKELISGAQARRIALLDDLWKKARVEAQMLRDSIEVLRQENVQLSTEFEEYKRVSVAELNEELKRTDDQKLMDLREDYDQLTKANMALNLENLKLNNQILKQNSKVKRTRK